MDTHNDRPLRPHHEDEIEMGERSSSESDTEEVPLKSKTKTEVISTDLSNPKCEHGPSILFSRNGRKFFACSVYRSRKLCPFYMQYEKWRRKRDSSDKANYTDAAAAAGIKRLAFKSTLNKGQAQYLFSSSSLAFIMKMLDDLKIQDVICVGVPSLHKLVQESRGRSYFLDIDPKFANLKNFSLYNMCNSYFYEDEGRAKYLRFLKSSKSSSTKEVAIVCDPPFGTKLELVIPSIRRIQEDLQSAANSENTKAKVILIHPYFSEGTILKIDPTLKMCDYIIEYDDHKKFRRAKKSPVRIFTDIPLSMISIPSFVVSANNDDAANSASEYKHCKICDKFVLAISEHCRICNRCNSKNGKPYTHCFDCGRCVKQTWVHCLACRKCHLPEMKECSLSTTSNSSFISQDKHKNRTQAKATRKQLPMPKSGRSKSSKKLEEKLLPSTTKTSKRERRKARKIRKT